MAKEKLIRDVKKNAEKLLDSINALLEITDESDQLEGQISMEELMEKPTIEDVRLVLADKSRTGHREEVKELLQKYGANKLSEIEEKNYPDLLKDAEEL